jgi:hypothetical protein
MASPSMSMRSFSVEGWLWLTPIDEPVAGDAFITLSVTKLYFAAEDDSQ